ncbi:MAG TPA: hypothetical protein VGL24_02765 [Chthoniobacterales bacterium]
MNDTVIFLVLAGLALLLKLFTRQSPQDSGRPTPPTPRPNERVAPPPMRHSPESEEERVRRFLEALGMPAGTQPPPPVRPRQVITPTASPPPRAQRPKVRRTVIQPLPPLVTTPPPLPTVTAAPPEPVFVEEITRPVVVTSLPVAAVPVLRPTASRPLAPAGSLGATLRSKASVRRAIMLREILGPPRGLQPLDV